LFRTTTAEEAEMFDHRALQENAMNESGTTYGLTRNERRVALLVAQGRTNHEVAAALAISPKTVEANLTRIYRKLRVRSRTELAIRALRSPGALAGSS
jgi:DNA-binding CsgD family transcriptional regulator